MTTSSGGGNHELFLDLARDEETVFVWVPGLVGIRGNSGTDSAATDTPGGNISNELIPCSDLKP